MLSNICTVKHLPQYLYQGKTWLKYTHYSTDLNYTQSVWNILCQQNGVEIPEDASDAKKTTKLRSVEMQHPGAITVMKSIEQELVTDLSKYRKMKYAEYAIKGR